MGKPKIFVTRPHPGPVMDALAQICHVTMRPENSYLQADELSALMADYDAILCTLGDGFSAKAFGGPDPKCKLIANFGVGFNHIDVQAATTHGIKVTNTPGPVTDPTADIAITLMLMTARRAGEGERLLRSGKWTGWHPTQLLSLHVSGKTLGVIGMGRIGKAIARRAHFGFGMDVVFHNRSQVTDTTVPGARQLGSIQEVMAAADVVSISVPGSAENHHLINCENLGAMQPHGILVNSARGDVIDEAALIAALQAGKLAGAGLDVFEFEPKIPAALLAMENVVLLPHMGTNALDVRTEMGMMAVENIRSFFAGKTPPNLV